MSLRGHFAILPFVVVLSACDDVYHSTVIRADRVQVTVDREPSKAGIAVSKPIETQINLFVLEHYRKCWIEASIPPEKIPYMPQVEFRLMRDGSLDGPPNLRNPSTDRGKQILGEQALQAVNRCSPIPMPEAYADYYDYWRTVDLDFRGNLPIESRPRQ